MMAILILLPFLISTFFNCCVILKINKNEQYQNGFCY